MTNFCFSKGVTYKVPRQNEGVIPAVLDRIWTVDNKRRPLLWEIGQTGSVCGDVFVKVAYEDEWTDPAGGFHNGRVRILPLNPSFCLDEETEILTSEGWKDVWQVKEGDLALCLDPGTDEIRWEPVQRVNRFDWDGPVTKWSNERFEAVSTDDHRWVVEDWRAQNPKYRDKAKHRIKTTGELNRVRQNGMRLITGGGTPMVFADQPKWSDQLVETVGWYVTEGHNQDYDAIVITQDARVNPEHADRIRALLGWWKAQAPTSAEYSYGTRASQFRLAGLAGRQIKEVAPGKQLTPEFLCSLTYAQARLLYETLLAGDGSEHRGDGPKTTTIWAQSSRSRIDGFQMLCAMLGLRTQAKYRTRLPDDHPYRPGNDCDGEVTVYKNRTTNVTDLKKERYNTRQVMWCPTTPTGTWYARKKGVMPKGRSGRQVCYWTGNCFP